MAMATPAGYLTEGATFGGETITGPPSKTAVDELLELSRQVEQLQGERQQLLQQLETAKQTIQQQGSAIDAASQELQHALDDYLKLRDGLAGWHSQLNQLDEQCRLDQRQQDELLDRLEAELQDILTRCEGQSDPPTTVSLVAPRNRTAARQVEAAKR
jgi:chromosome segregation ATPase